MSSFLKKLDFSAGFILMTAALYFFDGSGLFAALFPAVIVHEAGHILALRAFGGRVRRLHFSMSGLSLDYSAGLNTGGELILAVAGPMFGAAYAVLCSILGRRLGSEYLLFTAGVSYVLTAFNLLPVSPLDGGRIVEAVLGAFLRYETAQKLLNLIGFLAGAGLGAWGIWLGIRGHGYGLFAAAMWILILNADSACKWRGISIK